MNKEQASEAGSALARRKHQRMTKEERVASARKAAKARWRAHREAQRLASDAAAGS